MRTSPAIGDIWSFYGVHFLVLAIGKPSNLCLCIEDGREDSYLMIGPAWEFIA